MKIIPSTRVQSLDIMRGLIMLLLAAESCHLYVSLEKAVPGNLLVQQFFHHPWHGLRFWDLVQPAFMLMAGSALYLSYAKNLQRGISWRSNLRKISGRCLKLLLCGITLHCIYAGELVWELWNVLSQLAVTIMLAYLIINLSATKQLLISFALLLITELLYRYSAIPGFDQAFVDGHNFGNYMDTLLMGKINNDGWVAINAIPTAAHTIWGVLAGKLLMSSKPLKEKLFTLFIAGSIALLLGFLLDGFGITPIIKRISTSSFVLASGGWILLLLLGIYWLTDIKQYNRYGWIFTVMGMNAIFIYLFFETVGMQWLNECVYIFIGSPAAALGIPLTLAAILNALVTLFIEWCLCYWLYKKGIFFKL